jgi:DNA-binding transcriptional ArsR family regulator
VVARSESALASSLGPNVRFLTGTGVELLLSVLPLIDLDGRERMTDGQLWADRAKQPGLQSAVKSFGHVGREAIINLLGVATESPAPRDGGNLLSHLRSLSAEDVVFNMAGGFRRTVRRLTPPDVIRKAVAGDRAARARFRETSMPDVDFWQASLRFLLSDSAEPIADRVISALAAWYEHGVQPFEAGLSQFEMDEVARLTSERASWPLDALLDRAAPGIEYVPPAEVDDVIFLPVVAVRPLVVFLDHRSSAIVAFPVAQDAASDPPERLVRMGKALGDELRLRALRAMAKGPSTLAELALELGVPRTTLGHHMGILRAAGLVTLTVEDGRWGRLRLRVDVADELPKMLREFTAGG